MRRALCLLLLPLCAAGCAPDLRESHPFDGASSSGPMVEASDMGDGITRLDIDATSKTAKVYVDLDEGREMKPPEAFDSNGWDISAQRFEIFINGGSTNPAGKVRVAVLDGQDFGALVKAPADGYLQDGATAVFADVKGGWYSYDLSVHRLVTRKGLVYVLQTSEGAYRKLQMLDYYDAAGTPGSLSMLVGPLEAP